MSDHHHHHHHEGYYVSQPSPAYSPFWSRHRRLRRHENAYIYPYNAQPYAQPYGYPSQPVYATQPLPIPPMTYGPRYRWYHRQYYDEYCCGCFPCC